jgi:hypothetical protein
MVPGWSLVAERRDVPEAEQRRRVARLAAVRGVEEDVDQVDGVTGEFGLAQPGLVRHSVQVTGVRGPPRRRRGHLARRLADAGQGDAHVGEGEEVRGSVPGEPPGLAVADVDPLAGHGGLVRGHADLLGQRQDVVLGGAHELPADLGHLAVAEVVVEQPPADPVAGLQDGHGPARGDEFARRGESGQSGADHDDVGSVCCAYGAWSLLGSRR